MRIKAILALIIVLAFPAVLPASGLIEDLTGYIYGGIDKELIEKFNLEQKTAGKAALVNKLAQTDSGSARNLLLKNLDSRDLNLRRCVWRALAGKKINRLSMEKVLAYRNDPDWYIRAVIPGMIALNSPDVFYPELFVFFQDENFIVRLKAFEAAGRIDSKLWAGKYGINPMDYPPLIRYFTLSRITDYPEKDEILTLTKILKEDPLFLREKAFRLLKERPIPLMDEFMISLLLRNEAWALEPLKRTINKKAHPALKPLLAGEKREHKLYAIQLLGAMDKKDSKTYIMELAGDTDITVKTAAAEALSQYRDEDIKRYFTGLLNSSYTKLAHIAAKALSEYGDKALAEPLIKSLDNKNAMAAVALAKHYREPDVAEAIKGSLSDNNWIIRSFGAKALAAAGDTTMIPEIAKLLHDDDVDVQISAVNALLEINSREGLPYLEEAASRWFEALITSSDYFLSGEEEKQKYDLLIDNLEKKYNPLRIHSILAIGEYDSRDFSDTLVRFYSEEKDQELRNACLKALCRINNTLTKTLLNDTLNEIEKLPGVKGGKITFLPLDDAGLLRKKDRLYFDSAFETRLRDKCELTKADYYTPVCLFPGIEAVGDEMLIYSKTLTDLKDIYIYITVLDKATCRVKFTKFLNIGSLPLEREGTVPEFHTFSEKIKAFPLLLNIFAPGIEGGGSYFKELLYYRFLEAMLRSEGEGDFNIIDGAFIKSRYPDDRYLKDLVFGDKDLNLAGALLGFDGILRMSSGEEAGKRTIQLRLFDAYSLEETSTETFKY